MTVAVRSQGTPVSRSEIVKAFTAKQSMPLVDPREYLHELAFRTGFTGRLSTPLLYRPPRTGEAPKPTELTDVFEQGKFVSLPFSASFTCLPSSRFQLLTLFFACA